MKYDGRTCQSHENITASPITILLPHSAVALSTEKLNPTVLAIIASTVIIRPVDAHHRGRRQTFGVQRRLSEEKNNYTGTVRGK